MKTSSLPVTLPLLQSLEVRLGPTVFPNTRLLEAMSRMEDVASPLARVKQAPGIGEPSDYVLVEEDGKLIGILTSRDVIRLMVQQQPLEQLVVGQVMSQPVITLQESALTHVSVAMDLLQQHQIKYLPLVDDQDHCVAILTAESLYRAALMDTLQATSLAEAVPAEKQDTQSVDWLLPSPVGLFRTDAKGICTYVSPRWCEISGLAPEAALGDGWQQRLHPEDRAHVVADWYNSVQENRLFKLEYRFLTPEGVLTWVYGQSIAETDASGQVVGYVGTITDISDRKQAELLLRQSEERYRSIYDQAAIGFVNSTMDCEGWDFNPCFAQMLGYSREELLQKTVYEITHPDDRDRISSDYQKLLTGELSSFVQEKRYLRKDGSFLWASTCVSLTRDACGKPTHSIAVIQDISDRKQAEIALQHVVAGTAAKTGREFFPALVSHVAHALNVSYVFVAEKKNNVMNVVAYWAKGKLQPNFTFDLADSPCEQVLQEGLSHCSTHLIEQCLNPLQSVGIEADSYLGIPLRDCHEQVLGTLCILDQQPMPNPEQAQSLLTVFAARAAAELERQRAGELLEQLNSELESKVKERTLELKDREQFLTTVLDAFPSAIFWKDRNSNFLGCNRVFQADAGLNSTEEIVGLSDYDLPWGQTQAESYRAYDRAVMDAAEAKLGLVEPQLQANGNKIWLETHKVPLRNIEGDVIGVLGTYQDITARREAEAALQQTNEELARATRLKDEFLANMSHELRTPLNAIQGLTEGLLDQVFGDLNEKQIDALQTIFSSGTHLLELINDILDVAKIESGQVSLNLMPTGVTSLCQSSLAFIKQQAQKKRIKLEVNIQTDLPLLYLDGRRMRQALINLLSNAVKFTPEQGQITLEVKQQRRPAELDLGSAVRAADAWLYIAVRDTGIGIAPENIPKLFQPFVQIDSALNRQYQGTGLGLILVKRIVELHGGEVTLESQLGEGSCFTLFLPKAVFATTPSDAQLPIAQSGDSKQDKIACSLNILLVEDNEGNRFTISSYLRAKGYQLFLANNGQEAIALAQSKKPDVILMDIQMPGMDGLEAIRQIRLDTHLAQVPILALTALAMPGDRDRCLAAGANEYLSKPVKLHELETKIQQLTVCAMSP